jgi:hypothetical protein
MYVAGRLLMFLVKYKLMYEYLFGDDKMVIMVTVSFLCAQYHM